MSVLKCNPDSITMNLSPNVVSFLISAKRNPGSAAQCRHLRLQCFPGKNLPLKALKLRYLSALRSTPAVQPKRLYVLLRAPRNFGGYATFFIPNVFGASTAAGTGVTVAHILALWQDKNGELLPLL